jgi:hypothetical protein
MKDNPFMVNHRQVRVTVESIAANSIFYEFHIDWCSVRIDEVHKLFEAVSHLGLLCMRMVSLCNEKDSKSVLRIRSRSKQKHASTLSKEAIMMALLLSSPVQP